MNPIKEDMPKFKNLLNNVFLICILAGFNTPFILSATIIEQLSIPEFNKIGSYILMIITMSFVISMAIKFRDYIKLF